MTTLIPQPRRPATQGTPKQSALFHRHPSQSREPKIWGNDPIPELPAIVTDPRNLPHG